MVARSAGPADAAAIALIYNEGIEDRVATFETEPRSAEDVRGWFGGNLPVVVVEETGQVIAFAAAQPYSSRSCYRGIADISVYVARRERGRGAGRMALEALITEATRAGLWKLLSRIFVENVASRKVGVYEKHAQLDGIWRDCVIVERLLP